MNGPKNIIGKTKKHVMKNNDNVIVGIYKITSPSGKVYIGQSVNVYKRWYSYNNLIKCKRNSIQPKVKNSFLKYGKENHIFEIIEECLLIDLDKCEILHKQEFINIFGWEKALFCDIFDKGGGPKSKEHREKIGDSLRNKPKPLGFGKKPEGYGDKVSKSNIGVPKPKPEGFGEKLSKINKGKKRSEETKLNISLSLMGNSFRSKLVLQYDLEDNFIREWNSMKEAKDYINNGKGGSIGCCCRGEQKKAYGFKWKYK